jgi:hypothetical protein
MASELGLGHVRLSCGFSKSCCKLLLHESWLFKKVAAGHLAA